MKDEITVKYIYSACIVTATPDLRIVHDPWFTEGVYDGSWFHFPAVRDPIESIGNVDLVYVSHIHPDHYDPRFLRKYFSTFGEKRIIIADHSPSHLAGKARADGLATTVLREPMIIGNTRIEIIPHKTGSQSDIDSAIIVTYFDGRRTHCVVNANDIIFDDAMIEKLRGAAGPVDVLLCGYTGAGPYPQTYFDAGDPELIKEAQLKKRTFFDRYRRLVAAIGAMVNIPFAGKYLLGGKLTALNGFRGVADATEVLSIDPRAVVLADEGGTIGTADLVPSSVRVRAYSPEDVARRERDIADRKMDYERLMIAEEAYQLPIKRLLSQAARRAVEKSECMEDYFFVFRLPSAERIVINANRAAISPIAFLKAPDPLPEPRSEIEIDIRYLFGLLTNVYHWNNAEVGSQFNTRRVPNVFNRQAQSFLNYLAL